MHSPPCETEDCFDLVINGVPFIPATSGNGETGRIRVNASSWCPDLPKRFQCGHNSPSTLEIAMVTRAILDEPPAESIGVDIRASQFNVRFQIITLNTYLGSPYCRDFRVIWEAPPRRENSVQGSKRALLGIVLEAGVQAISTWQIRQGMFPVDGSIGQSMKHFGSFMVSYWSSIDAWVRWLVCAY